MQQFFHGERRPVRQMFLTGLFHFIHAFTTILLLLLVGQIISQSDSTKSKLLERILLGLFQSEAQWYWVFALLLCKFLGTSLRNYYLQSLPLRLQVGFQNFWLSHTLQPVPFNPDKDIRNYGRALIKGRVLWLADICLLLLIFLLLLYLHLWVALCWVLLWGIGLMFRWWVVHFFLNAKKDWKKAKAALQRKWNFLFINQFALRIDQQWKKELRIEKRREKKAEETLKAFSFQKAWTSGFFPVYFFGFIFILAWIFQITESDQTISLQIILMILYSQGAFMRSFRSPEYWKTIRLIEKKWSRTIIESKQIQPSSSADESDKVTEATFKNLNAFTNQDWEKWLPVFYVKENESLISYKPLFRNVALLDFRKLLLGETFLAAIVSDKESVQLPVLQEFLSLLEKHHWDNFPWKENLEITIIREKQLAWLHLFKALLHPGRYILCTSDLIQKIGQNDFDVFLSLVNKRKKKLILLHGSHS
jgi:hypothetical protein